MKDRREPARAYSVVLVASLPPPIVGQSVATKILVDGLRGAGIEYRVVDLSRDFHRGNRAWQLARRALTVTQLPARVARAARAMKGRPTILYLQLGHGPRAMLRDIPILALARAAGWPIVAHVHGAGLRRAYGCVPAPIRALYKSLLASVSRAVALSPSLESMFTGLVPVERVVSISNGTEPATHNRARNLTRRAPHSPPTVLYLGNLIPSKGYEVVLNSAKLSAERGCPYRFVIAGAATEATTIDPASFIKRHGLENARYVGPVYGPDKLGLLESCDIFALPASGLEGQPIAILEAMQFGLPVVTTRMGGIPDIIADGINGALIAPRDPEALLAAVERLSVPTRWAGIAERNRNVALALYSAEAHCRRMIALLDEVAALASVSAGDANDGQARSPNSRPS
jgi:glycosyltransferase involved in cell wall biosynthesis